MTLTDFLLARIGDVEALARVAQAFASTPWRATYGRQVEQVEPGRLVTPEDEYASSKEPPDDLALHIARHDPARVLADCAARRAIVELHAPVWMETDDEPYCSTCGGLFQVAYPCDTLRHLAAPYASHPDFDPAWAVS